MTYEQAQSILANMPTQRELGIKLAKDAIAKGLADKIAQDTNLDKLFGKEVEAGFHEYFNAWKIMQKYN
jgi:hypothetical protein